MYWLGFVASVGLTPIERFCLDAAYSPYPMQCKFHASPSKYKLLGGAAGPGKTLAMIVEQMICCNEFTDPVQAKQVHTLLLRRTYPMLERTVLTRFREKIPKELYSKFNEVKGEVTWKNGSTTNFGSMQHETDVWNYQGQWLQIGFDEAAEFTFKQWASISAWNRCPVSPWATKYGASNPIGVGAGWLKSLFVDGKPCEEMDESQRSQYRGTDYSYFPCTYLDNPVYANDPVFLANLEAYPVAIRDALKYGTWGIVGGYFTGAWDPAENVYDPRSFKMQPWYARWLSGDWGFKHWSAIYWHCIDQLGIIRTYHELCVKQQPPEDLAKLIIMESERVDSKGSYDHFYFSHDAFHQKTDANTVAVRMGRILAEAGFPMPANAGTDKIGREQLMYQLMKNRIKTGVIYESENTGSVPVLVPAWQISAQCDKLINVIPLAPRDEKKVEQISEFEGDDPIAGAGHGIYGRFGKMSEEPREYMIARKLAEIPDYTKKAMAHKWLEKNTKKTVRSFRLH